MADEALVARGRRFQPVRQRYRVTGSAALLSPSQTQRSGLLRRVVFSSGMAIGTGCTMVLLAVAREPDGNHPA